MLLLNKSKLAWSTAEFPAVFKQEVCQYDSRDLPLYAAMSVGNHVVDTNLQVMLLNSVESETHIKVKAGIFFSSIIAGCACADDPTPVSENAEYCEVLFEIDKGSAETSVTLQN